ncbi:class I SAM-dependent methyltransferase [Paludisphaera rhizosphaerae]|uniref:class I SAM-dependent methyltransferase n=1 Tax=Paludisphaera rhizosphaerae TaxID=2711216 RepID=UPI001F104E0D|nr:methyltransferase domain-containing protein [Paludisphaera rhizosphaerae]
MSKIPLPPVVKRPLVTAWNEAHRVGWLLRDHADAILHGRVEPCSVCGRRCRMLYRRRVIPPRLVELWGLTERQAEALARKESNDCAGCGAKLRARRMAEVLLDLFPVAGTRLADLRTWAGSHEAGELRIAEINRIDGIHEVLSNLARFHSSEYVPNVRPGAYVSGIRNESLMGLTYENARFDLVLTSETLEHVPELNRALAEIRRVLVPGGLHVFTVPVSPNEAKTFPRARLRHDGSFEGLTQEIRHPGGDVGYPVFTELGLDFPEILKRAGFETEVRFGPVSDDDLAQVYVCRKPTA